MLDCYITFRSITRAQRGSALLENLGISHQLLRTPKSLAAQGCGYTLRTQRAFAYQAVQALRQNEIAYQRVYTVSETGQWEELRI